MEVIKKYQNRKMYSTEQKAYVDLKYINDLVKMGKFGRFQVICNQSKEDITNDVLKQSLLLTNPSKDAMVDFIRNN